MHLTPFPVSALVKRAIVLDPLEWLYTRTLYTAMLQNLNFQGDYEAARLACSCYTYDGDLLRDFNWEDVTIVMPPFESRPVKRGVLIAVEGYTARRLLRLGLKPDLVVTDLDFEPEALFELDSVILAHAHGDNIDVFLRLCPKLKKVIPTVQVWPKCPSLLVPGFTDGDRAVYLAYYMGARVIRIYGFNPNKPVKRDDFVKRVKLEIASALIRRVLRNVRAELYP